MPDDDAATREVARGTGHAPYLSAGWSRWALPSPRSHLPDRRARRRLRVPAYWLDPLWAGPLWITRNRPYIRESLLRDVCFLVARDTRHVDHCWRYPTKTAELLLISALTGIEHQVAILGELMKTSSLQRCDVKPRCLSTNLLYCESAMPTVRYGTICCMSRP